jgi:hypothetical protein
VSVQDSNAHRVCFFVPEGLLGHIELSWDWETEEFDHGSAVIGETSCLSRCLLLIALRKAFALALFVSPQFDPQ